MLRGVHQKFYTAQLFSTRGNTVALKVGAQTQGHKCRYVKVMHISHTKHKAGYTPCVMHTNYA